MKTSLAVILGAVTLAGCLFLLVVLALIYQIGKAIWEEFVDIMKVLFAFCSVYIILLFSPFIIAGEWWYKQYQDVRSNRQSIMWINRHGQLVDSEKGGASW